MMSNSACLMVLGVMAITVMLAPSTVLGFEKDTTYFLDDSESISITIDVNSKGVASFEEVFVNSPDGELYIMNKDTITHERISQDHSYGKFFGKTSNNESVFVIYKIVGNDVELLAKVWAIDEKIRISTLGEITVL